MSWRTVVISSSAKLDYHMGYMVVRSLNSKNFYAFNPEFDKGCK